MRDDEEMVADADGWQYGLELIIIIFATLAQSLTSSSPAVDIVGVIIFWRVIMGIGKIMILVMEIKRDGTNLIDRNRW